jgi:hypothetical protein
MTREIGINCAFGGTNQDWATLAGMVGTRSGTLEIDGMKEHVPTFVRRERGNPMDYAGIGPIADHKVCPTAYALARHAGYDPAAILLLLTVECEVRLDLPGWPDPIVITAGDTHDDVCGPVGPGMMWARDPMTDAPQIRVYVAATGLPETVLGLIPERIEGRALRHLVSHPVLDGMDIVVDRVRMSSDRTQWHIEISGAPAEVTLREAARLYEGAL